MNFILDYIASVYFRAAMFHKNLINWLTHQINCPAYVFLFFPLSSANLQSLPQSMLNDPFTGFLTKTTKVSMRVEHLRYSAKTATFSHFMDNKILMYNVK